MKWYVTGDIHRSLTRFKQFKRANTISPENINFIILGDVGANFYLNNKDFWFKSDMNKFGYTFYCVRGNHEARPNKVPGIIKKYDDLVKNYIYIEEQFPNIKYLIDGEVYYFDGYKTLVVGGAYSVDKYYRLQNDLVWFSDEQLNPTELKNIMNSVKGKSFDLILTHTAPYDWEPIDLFLNFIDQSTVDKTMEYWFNILKDEVNWKVWLFGHYHADRLEKPKVEMFYEEIEELKEIMERWEKEELDWWLPLSPYFNKKNNHD